MIRIDAIEPTVLFIKGENGLLQMVNITIENTSEVVEAGVDVKFGSMEPGPISCFIGKLEKGREIYQIYVPDIRVSVCAEFKLKVNGEVQDQRSINWEPRKHWQIYMIPIAHHDLGYTDTIEGVLREYDSFYEDILRFCDETENWPEESKFRYMVEETWSIQHFIENSSEESVKKLAKYIREGRIEIPALFGNEISGMCSHEELIRLMYPSFRIKRRYGAPIRTASITDIPGLSWGLATTLAGAGVKYFFAGLPTYFHWGRNDIHTFWDEAAILREHGRPDAFRWQGPDGQTVLVYYQGGYGCWSPSSYGDVLEQLPDMLNDMDERGCPFSVMRYGGYGCYDNLPPDIRVSYIAREWNGKWAYPKLILGTNAMFFEELERQCQDIRTFSGELPHTDYAVGAISTAKETAINRVAHDKLHSAEKFAAIASLLGNHSYPAEEIRKAYDNMMLYDEHTWGWQSMDHARSVQDWVWSEKGHYAYKASGLAESILSRSLEGIANSISLDEEGQHIVVFNSLSFQRTDLVNIPNFLMEGSFDLIDAETGQKQPYQVVKLDSPQAPTPYSGARYARGQSRNHELFNLAFVAENVPPLGYKTYRIVPEDETGDIRREGLKSEVSSPESSFHSSVVLDEASLENRFFKIGLDPQTGTIESIYDKELSREIVDRDAPHQLNQFIARWVKSGEQESPERAEIRKGQSGAIYGSLVVSGKGAGCPQLTQEIILYDKIRRIDIANRVLKDSTAPIEIYFAFPFKIGNPNFRFEGSNSVIEPLRDQFPGSNSNYYSVQHWADVSDGEVGVTFCPIDSHLVEFGGLWPCYVSQAHHSVAPPDYGADFVKSEDMTRGHMYSYVIDSNFRTNFQPVQPGDILFRYSITTHKGDWKEGKPRDFGWAAGNPLIPMTLDGKKASTGIGLKSAHTWSFCQVDKPNVLLLTLKRAEDGDGTIVRLIETEGKDVNVTVMLPLITIERAHQTNLVEENERILPAQHHAVTVPIKASGITTIRVQ